MIAKNNAELYDLTFSEFTRQLIIEEIEKPKSDSKMNKKEKVFWAFLDKKLDDILRIYDDIRKNAGISHAIKGPRVPQI